MHCAYIVEALDVPLAPNERLVAPGGLGRGRLRRPAVVLDHVKHEWDDVPVESLRDTLRPGLLWPNADECRDLLFSPDSAHLAYAARIGASWCMTLDGAPVGPPCTEVTAVTAAFSPDSAHLAYPARIGSSWWMVVDGAPVGPPCTEITAREPTFSSDSRRLAYSCRVADEATWDVAVHQVGSDAAARTVCGSVFNGVGSIGFSAGGKRLAYSALAGDKWCVVTWEDGPVGAAGPTYDKESYFTFSPDGQHLAYAGARGDTRVVVLDGVERASYDGADAAYVERFSPDSSRLAWRVQRAGKVTVVVDGAEAPECDEALFFEFSTDSAHTAYACKTGAAWSVVLDGQAVGAGYDHIELLEFGSDSRTVGYLGTTGSTCEYVAGTPLRGPAYDYVHAAVTSPSKQHVAWVACKKATRRVVAVLDGKEGPEYGSISHLSLDDAGMLEYIGDHGDPYRVRQRP
jgi:hypothetical protein